ncbi:MAG: DUF6141 family protein [Saprospiraceae bacterium]|nr:DUF6141 family protein [Saprospiraceae bacterium]
MKTLKFTEVQDQKQKWIYYVVILFFLLPTADLIQRYVFHLGDDSPSILFMIGFYLVPIALFILLKTTILITEIDETGISYRYKPFHTKFRKISWEEIDKCYIRIYRPMKEYGGYGYRTVFNKKHGKAFNVSGKIGLQLELKNGQKILIGTQKSEELKSFLQQIKKG